MGRAAGTVPAPNAPSSRSDRMTDRTTHRQVVYRLLPGSRAKARRLAALAGACRFVWNEMLDQQEQLYAIARMQGAKPPALTFFTLGKAFTQLRRSRRGENHRLRGAAAGWATRIAEGPLGLRPTPPTVDLSGGGVAHACCRDLRSRRRQTIR